MSNFDAILFQRFGEHLALRRFACTIESFEHYKLAS